MGNKLRILPLTPVQDTIDTLLCTRDDIRDLLVLRIHKDGSPDIITTGRTPIEVIGLLELIKKQLLDSSECEHCNMLTFERPEPHE